MSTRWRTEMSSLTGHATAVVTAQYSGVGAHAHHTYYTQPVMTLRIKQRRRWRCSFSRIYHNNNNDVLGTTTHTHTHTRNKQTTQIVVVSHRPFSLCACNNFGIGISNNNNTRDLNNNSSSSCGGGGGANPFPPSPAVPVRSPTCCKYVRERACTTATTTKIFRRVPTRRQPPRVSYPTTCSPDGPSDDR